MVGAPVAAAQSSLPGSSFGSSLGSSLGSSWGSSQSSSEGSSAGDDVQPGEGTESRVLWLESFDGVDTPAWFTHRAPEGWKTDVHGVDSGEARWKGWTFGDMRHWTWASGTDMRHYFTQAHDTFAIIDNKQQRLAEGDSMTAGLKSPAIPVAGQERVNVEFDHHYRQGKDGQNAKVTVSFDGGEAQEIAVFDKDVFSKHESIGVDVPAGAKNMQVSFSYNNGNDDWWWAVDNVGVVKPLGELQGSPQATVDVLSDVQGDPKTTKTRSAS